MSDEELYAVFLEGTAGPLGIDGAIGAMKRGVRAVWEARQRLDAKLCRTADNEPLDPSASCEYFAKIIESKK